MYRIYQNFKYPIAVRKFMYGYIFNSQNSHINYFKGQP